MSQLSNEVNLQNKTRPEKIYRPGLGVNVMFSLLGKFMTLASNNKKKIYLDRATYSKTLCLNTL